MSEVSDSEEADILPPELRRSGTEQYESTPPSTPRATQTLEARVQTLTRVLQDHEKEARLRSEHAKQVAANAGDRQAANASEVSLWNTHREELEADVEELGYKLYEETQMREDREADVQDIDCKLAEKDRQLEEKDRQLAEKDRQLAEKDRRISEFES